MRWVAGTAAAVDAREIDFVTMTGNVARAIVDPGDWHATLGCVHNAWLRQDGWLFGTR